MKLLIVESPNKVKKIQSFLGEDWIVDSSKGHIFDLESNNKYGLGVDLETMTPSYKISSDKKKIVKDLLDKAKECKEVFIATDPDREGEAIGANIASLLGDLDCIISRVTFNEITEESVLEAVNNPGEINQALVNAQETRRIIDRIIGYRLSAFSRKKVSGRSAGRVKSALLHLIINREVEINNFVSESWFELSNEEGNIYLLDEKRNKLKTSDRTSLENTIKELTEYKQVDQKVSEKTIKRPLPLEMSTALSAIYNAFGYSNSKASSILQNLYESGMITYPRTDSKRISSASFIGSVKKHIEENYNEEFVGQKSLSSGQDAHEAIRPTNINKTPSSVKLTGDKLNVYKLIWNTTVKSFLPNSVNEITKTIYENSGHEFAEVISKVKKPGFKIVDSNKEEKQQTISNAKLEIVDKKTKPPARYNPASLIKLMKEEGIGRPSTYSSASAGLVKYGYIELENKKYIPTELGIEVDLLLQKSFTDFINPKTTSEMETLLDSIAEGNVDHKKTLFNFWKSFSEQFDREDLNIAKKQPKLLEEKCPKCSSSLVERNGRYGKFKGCSNFPKCKYIEDNSEKSEETCPNCGKNLVIRKNKRNGNEFLACPGFPKCKYIKS